MKPRIYFGRGQWWCSHIGVTGCGATPGEAWFDMWDLYREVFAPKVIPYQRPRFA